MACKGYKKYSHETIRPLLLIHRTKAFRIHPVIIKLLTAQFSISNASIIISASAPVFISKSQISLSWANKKFPNFKAELLFFSNCRDSSFHKSKYQIGLWKVFWMLCSVTSSSSKKIINHIWAVRKKDNWLMFSSQFTLRNNCGQEFWVEGLLHHTLMQNKPEFSFSNKSSHEWLHFHNTAWLWPD